MKMHPLPKEVLAWLSAERLLNKETCKKADLQYVIRYSKGYVAIPNCWEDGKAMCWKCRIAPGFKFTKKDKWFFHPSESNSPVYGPTLWPKKEVAVVYRFEGELDCLLGIQAGLAALTSSTGVGTAMESCLEYVPHGAQLVLGHDNDDSGDKATKKISKIVAEQRPDIRLCRIAWPSGFKKDLTDFAILCKKEGKDFKTEIEKLICTCETESQETHDKKTSADEPRNERETQAHIIVREIQDGKNFLFCDQFEDAHAHVPVNNHWETRKITSKKFEHWMRMLLWQKMQKIPSTETLHSVINLLEAHACHTGKSIDLYNRIASKDGAILYDLSDASWRFVEITSSGWRVIDEPLILFRRYGHQAAQVEPQHGGSLDLLKQCIDIMITDPGQQLLFIVCLVSFFIPDFPHAIPNFYGSFGSAKTTLFKIMRRLVDPSKMEVLSFPGDKSELIQQLSHHWLPLYDNVPSISEEFSAILCRAITGTGHSKRKLYTNDDDWIYSFRCCVGLNGVNMPAQQSDLLDRSLLFKLERIPEDRRRREEDVLKEFEQRRALILGAIFDAVAKAMRLRGTIILERLPRMADFAIWGCAIAEALGHDHADFLRAYNVNIGEQHEEAIDASTIATAITVFVEEKMQATADWSGTATELLVALTEIAEFGGGKIHKRSLPKAPQHLTKRLNEVKTNLAQVGILIETHRTGKARMITIQKTVGTTVTSVTSSQTVAASDEDSDGDTESSASSRSSPEKAQEQAKSDDGDTNDDAFPF